MGDKHHTDLRDIVLMYLKTVIANIIIQESFEVNRAFYDKDASLRYIVISLYDSPLRLQSHNYEERYRTVEGELRKLVAMRGN